MRTPDMSDEELDALFQRSAENYPDEHNLSAWLQMERKLDQAAAGQLVRQRVLRTFALEAVVVLVALLGWWSYSQYQRPAATAGQPAAAQSVATSAEATTIQPQQADQQPATKSAGSLARRQSAPMVLSNVPNSLSTAVESTSAAQAAMPTMVRVARSNRFAQSPRHPMGLAVVLPARRSKPPIRTTAEPYPTAAIRNFDLADTTPEARPAAAEPNSRLQTGSPGPTAALAVTNPTRQPASLASALTPTADNTAATAPVAPGTAVAAAMQPGSEPLPDRPPGATFAADSAATAFPVVAAAAKTLTDSVPQEQDRPRRGKPAYRLSIGGLYAPELSTVGWTKTTAPGSNLGILVEYRFTDRLRLNVAAIRSVKRYVARGSDYTVPAGTWDGNYTIDHVGAVCRIIDLPINLRYDVVHRENTAVFVSAGLTSLLMRDEQYAYDYEYYGKYYTRDWNVTNGSNHWLSVVNLSAGYERNFGLRWSGQAEPFVKVPLGGVGFGKVKLSSAGVFFSLKYHLLPTR